MKAVVYTADTGGYDRVQPVLDQDLPDGWTLEWRYLVGEPWMTWPPRRHAVNERFMEALKAGWSPNAVNRGPSTEDWSDRLVSRWAKCHAHVLFPEADLTIWVDACLQVTSRSFVADLIHQSAPEGPFSPLVLFPHPDRSDVHQEVEAADTLRKYQGNSHAAMVGVLEAVQGRAAGLWAMTFMARRRSPLVRLVDHLTWTTTFTWSGPTVTALDQLILPFALQWAGLDPYPALSGSGLWDNPWFIRHPHRREEGPA